MATKKMLIDTTHAEETRVVIVNGNRLEEFDVEVESKRQLKSNIYLAKVTRVEPSLQAAFVDFGGNRHGFLAFSEIHPDYYQIPVADREALIAEQLEAEADDDDAETIEDGDSSSTSKVESVGGDDMEETEKRRPVKSRRNYKIQEVIKRRQILLVQVVKEERGNKGAALTTYISLPGRYCVLMPNTARGGGISRKISNASDRRKLKSILSDLDIPTGVAVIVRTAGSKRTKAEIKRDYDYLMRLWNQVRETTLESIAPCVVYEEGNLIKRAIRDLYTKDIDEIVVDGSEGYRTAKDFMKLLIPSHSKRVQPHKEESTPLFHRYQVETQLDAIHEPVAPLRSGGYLVINQTEALVAIDVNSGKATRERNIEETALQTNLEAADEVARQLRLRDLAGLVVVDFIDMEIHRNQTKVERQLKEAMRSDRARIQMGRISPFGLMELSRQRLRPSLIETSTEPCPHCGGTGALRSIDSASLSVLRAIEEEGMRGRSSAINVSVATPIALYILNQKRTALAEIEARYSFQVMLLSDDSLIAPAHNIERIKNGVSQPVTSNPSAPQRDDDESADGDTPRKKRRRRPRRRRRGGEEGVDQTDNVAANAAEDVESSDDPAEETDDTVSASDDESAPKKRRRGRRGGRRRQKNRDDHNSDVNAPESNDEAVAVSHDEKDDDNIVGADAKASEESVEDKPKRTRRKPARSKKTDADSAASDGTTESASQETAKPALGRRAKKDTAGGTENEAAQSAIPDESEITVSQPVAEAPIRVIDKSETATDNENGDSPEPTIAAKTTTIVVGEEASESAGSKRGWWRR